MTLARALCVAALVLLAGCGGTPAGTATTGDTAAQSTTEPTPTGATPTTGEQILHGSSPVSEPLRELTVRTEVSEHWTVDEDRGWRLGEPVLRYVLETGLSEERAADAAGWGNDYVAVFERGDESGYAWVIRWDSVDAAAEFESAFGHYERPARSRCRW